jgi:hypothetical protein
MKTKKLGVIISKFGLEINKCQRGDTPQTVTFKKQVSSILCLKMLVKSNAGILSAFLAVILPSLLDAKLGAKIFSASTAEGATLKVATQEASLVEDKSTDKFRSSLSPFSVSSSSFMVAEAEAGTTPAVENGTGGSGGNIANPSSPSTSPIIPSSSPNIANPESSVNSPTNSQNSPTPQGGQGTVQAPSQPTALPSGIQGQKVKLDIAPAADPRAQADGRSTVKLRGTLTDEKGQPILGDVIVTLTTSAGKFVGADQSRDQQGFQVIARDGEFIANLQADIKPQQVRVRAAVDKIRVRQSTSVSPNVTQLDSRIVGSRADGQFPQQTDTSILEKLRDSPLEAYTQVEFVTFLRPSLATGIINLRIGQKGTDYWGSFGDFLNPRTIDGGTGVDFKASVFATGRVGEWLFTGAFNSSRPLNQDCEGRNRLFGSIQFCEQQYPVYGDSSTMTPTTPSIDSVYARFERTPSIPGAEPDYLMWGDYNTEEFARSSQLYTATTRQLHGLKLNYNFGALQITGMYANNIEGFQRDTFVPNGTSGNYFLSQRLIVPGSETVYLESEEINRSGTVVERQALYRDQDYEIDYDRGTLLFRRPISATDSNPFGVTLVRRVVVSYQNEGGKDSSLYAGRLQYNFSNDINKKSFFGGSYLREDQGDSDFQLYGADFLVSFGSAGKIVGEFARSNSDLLTGNSVDGNAYRIEASGNIGDRVSAQGYYRGVEPNFVNNATSSFSPGQTRYGASLIAKLSQTTTFKAAYDFEENYGTAAGQAVDYFDLFDPQPQARSGERVSNDLQTFRVGLLQRLGTGRLSPEVGVEYVNRNREDRVSDRLDGDAQQIVSQLKVPLAESLLFQAKNELNLGDSDPLYPNRTTLGLDWKAYPGVTFRLTHQFFDRSELIKGNSITTFDTLLDSKLSENTAVTGRYSVLSGYDGLEGQGSVGLKNRWAIAPGLRLNLGYEYIFKNMFNATGTGSQFEQYYTVGQTSSSLGLFSGAVYSLGLEYTDNPNYQVSTRFEYRDGSESNNLVISAAAAGKISPALTGLIRYQQAGEANVFLPSSSSVENVSGVRFQELGDTSNLKIGLAYRDPTNDKFNGLLKYEWRQNFDSTPESQVNGSTVTGHTFSAEGIYAPTWNWEFFGKFALRNGVTFSDGDRYDGTTKLAQLRATYRLGYRNDLAVEGRWIGQDSNNDNGYTEYGLAVESGYYLTPDLRVAAGYSFGSVDVNGDRDFSGYRSNGGFYLNISLKLNELLGGFGLQKPVPKQQQESVVQPVSGVVPQTPPANPFPTNPSRESQPTPSIEFQQPGQTQPPQSQIPQEQNQTLESSSQGTQLQPQPSPQIDPQIGQFGNQDAQQTAPNVTFPSEDDSQRESQNLLMNRLRRIQPENVNTLNTVNSSSTVAPTNPTENNQLENQLKPEEKLPQLIIQQKQSQQQLINLLKQQNRKPQAKVQGVEEERSED